MQGKGKWMKGTRKVTEKGIGDAHVCVCVSFTKVQVLSVCCPSWYKSL